MSDGEQQQNPYEQEEPQQMPEEVTPQVAEPQKDVGPDSDDDTQNQAAATQETYQ